MLLLRSIVWYTYFAFSLVISTPALLRLRKKKDTFSTEIYADKVAEIAKRWCLGLIKWCGSNFILLGKENLPSKGPVVYVANHQSIFDIGIFLSYLPFPKSFIAKIEILRMPIIRSWMTEMNCIFMDRQDIKKSAKAINDGIEILKNGHSSMVIFPEGHRSRSDTPGEFKAGAFKLAVRSKVPIIPITIDGTHYAFESNNYFIKPIDIKVTVHPIIQTADLTREEAIELPKKVKEIIASKLPACES